MPDKAMSSKQDSERQPRRRKHGYRGYPNNRSGGGDIHWGSGFAGIGSFDGSGSAGLPNPGVITERTRMDAARVEDED
jgi:hypothetical protein